MHNTSTYTLTSTHIVYLQYTNTHIFRHVQTHLQALKNITKRGCSSSGRAIASHAKSPGFKSRPVRCGFCVLLIRVVPRLSQGTLNKGCNLSRPWQYNRKGGDLSKCAVFNELLQPCQFAAL